MYIQGLFVSPFFTTVLHNNGPMPYNLVMHFRIPLWLRITIAVLLAALLIAVIFIGGRLLLDIWAESKSA